MGCAGMELPRPTRVFGLVSDGLPTIVLKSTCRIIDMLTAGVPTEASHRRTRPGLRDRLCAATAEAHQRLDTQLGALDLQSRDGYRQFLAANAAALLPLERALEEAGVHDILPDWDQRARTRAILADLARLGGAATPLPTPATLDFGATLGTLYVLEGSRLGAAVLTRIVAQSSDTIVATATAYLRHGAGERLWPSFLARLDALTITPHHEACAIEAARAAFDLFAQAAHTAGRQTAA